MSPVRGVTVSRSVQTRRDPTHHRQGNGVKDPSIIRVEPEPYVALRVVGYHVDFPVPHRGPEVQNEGVFPPVRPFLDLLSVSGSHGGRSRSSLFSGPRVTEVF